MNRISRISPKLVATTVIGLTLSTFLLPNFVKADVSSDMQLSEESIRTMAFAPSEPVDRLPEMYTGSFLDRDVASMLQRLGVVAHAEDKIEAFPDPVLGIGSHIKIWRAQVVTVKDGAKTDIYRTWSPTVKALLEEQQYELADKDIVKPALSTPLTAEPLSISITRVAISTLVTTKAIPFTTTNQNDNTLEKGKQKVITAGKAGLQSSTFEVRRENGAEVSRKLMSTRVVTEPVTQVVAIGTKPKVAYLTSGQYADLLNKAADKYAIEPAKLKTLMMCESGGNINAVGARGLYYGLFQFDKSTWARTAYASKDIFDPEAQIMAAASLWNSRSSKWPTCSKGL